MLVMHQWGINDDEELLSSRFCPDNRFFTMLVISYKIKINTICNIIIMD